MKPLLAAVIAVVAAAAAALGLAVARDGNTPITCDDGVKALVVDDRARIGYAATVPLWRDVGVAMMGPDVQRSSAVLTMPLGGKGVQAHDG
jgi:hypothetical protein